MKLKMKLEIFKLSDSTSQWKMTYVFNGKEDVRDYLLIEKDVEKGHFIIDERNSILIDGYYKSGIFTSFFKVSNAFIITTYTKINDNILFEIISGSDKDARKSGGQKNENQQIPEVLSYLVNGRQKALLIKE